MNSNEIAKLANVSRSTVSRVVNNYSNVPESTRKKVQAIIDKYGYTPSSSARTLAGKSNNIIALVIADMVEPNRKWVGIESPYYSRFLAKLVKEAKKRDYLVLVQTISKEEECLNLAQHFENRLVFGGIFIGFKANTYTLDELAKKNFNAVFIDQYDVSNKEFEHTKIVNCNDYEISLKLMQYLIDNGHKDIAFLKGDDRMSAHKRYAGYLKALEINNIKVNQNLILEGNFRRDKAYELIDKLIDNENFTAIFASNDVLALGAFEALKKHNLKVPDDVSLVGFDNIRFLEFSDLELTTVNVSMQEMAKHTIDLLFSKDERSRMCNLEIIKRSTVKKLN